ncbi:class I SAM-dependent methyltransferase [Bradyrhizobium sp. STM 3809]|uniref:class I SAM-dependent methyltransferase n=1 Tax=Bradyrhizobium sp. STM 3809 TaxID=551936 RepID=UPI0002407CEA|nr:class I SAM-dependent methyltransferase [Bradyrhizobium sp. STM 3809]CCE02661.1 Methyltransferase type 11 [Bradyrhizobium sp. STM 3809]
MPDDMIVTTDDLLAMLDTFLADRQGQWWDTLFSRRNTPIPFFVEKPDENLVQMFASGALRSGKTLELGCGHGRNARYFADQDCEIDAVDFSRVAIEWATEFAPLNSHKINYIHDSIYNLILKAATYDIVYDSGCFHHQAPHRRGSYLDLVATVIKPGGSFVLVCFSPEGGGGLTDRQIYEKPWLGSGIGYSEEQLSKIFLPKFVINECRRMRETGQAEPVFGKAFLWVSR